MAQQDISALDYDHFRYHIIATFAHFLNNIKQYSYKKLNNNWWKICAKEFVPILDDKGQTLEDTQKKLFDRVMAEFPIDFLTEAQSNKLLSLLGIVCQNFIGRPTFTCYCGDRGCDGDCGVQSCGSCIDVCRCNKYNYRD